MKRLLFMFVLAGCGASQARPAIENSGGRDVERLPDGRPSVCWSWTFGNSGSVVRWAKSALRPGEHMIVDCNWGSLEITLDASGHVDAERTR